MKANASESILNVIVILVLILACVGILSSVMWYKTFYELADARLITDEQARTIQKLTDEVADKRYKITQANRLLSVAYPGAEMNFLSED